MSSLHNGMKIIDELAAFVHDLRREQAADILHHFKTENFDAYMAVLGAFCDGSYVQSSTLKRDEAKDIVFKIVTKIGELAQDEEGLSDWMEACRKSFKATIKKIENEREKERETWEKERETWKKERETWENEREKEKDEQKEKDEDKDDDKDENKESDCEPVSDKLKDFIVERYGKVYTDAGERYKEIAIEMLDKVSKPISEQMAFNVSMSFVKAISGELSQPLSTGEQRGIAKRTVNGIRGLLTTAYRIHVTGKRMDG